MRFQLRKDWQAMPELHQCVLEDKPIQTLLQEKAKVSNYACLML